MSSLSNTLEHRLRGRHHSSSALEGKVLRLCILLKLLDLVDDTLEDSVSRQVIELSKSSMNTLRVLEANITVAVSFVDSFRLALENNILDLELLRSFILRFF